MLRVAQSSRRTTLLCRGEGVEPRLEFSRSLVQFSGVVPHFAVEEELTICNPCNFPIELYSVEFDKMHLEDEKVTSLCVIVQGGPTVYTKQRHIHT